MNRAALLSSLAYWLLRLLAPTLRYRLEDDSGQIRPDAEGVFLFAFWHNQIALMPHLYRKYLRRRRIATLISASRDGEILAGVLSRFGFTPVRGSSSRRGSAALRGLSRLVRDGHDAAITPDGPRGPRYQVQGGIIDLAALTGRPIYPVATLVWPRGELKSWDGFQVPLPFARCTVRVGVPLAVARDADAETREAKRKELEERLRRLSL